jgi:hypothetical protein
MKKVIAAVLFTLSLGFAAAQTSDAHRETIPLNGTICESVAEQIARNNGFNEAAAGRWTYGNIGGLVKTRIYVAPGRGSVFFICPVNGGSLQYVYRNQEQLDAFRKQTAQNERAVSNIVLGAETK